MIDWKQYKNNIHHYTCIQDRNNSVALLTANSPYLKLENYGNYSKLNKYAKYNFAISVNIDKENLGEWLMIHQIHQYSPCQNFPMYSNHHYIKTTAKVLCLCALQYLVLQPHRKGEGSHSS